jgi:hypothetical protein
LPNRAAYYLELHHPSSALAELRATLAALEAAPQTQESSATPPDLATIPLTLALTGLSGLIAYRCPVHMHHETTPAGEHYWRGTIVGYPWLGEEMTSSNHQAAYWATLFSCLAHAAIQRGDQYQLHGQSGPTSTFSSLANETFAHMGDRIATLEPEIQPLAALWFVALNDVRGGGPIQPPPISDAEQAALDEVFSSLRPKWRKQRLQELRAAQPRLLTA